eukprot:COSAG04_NODE_748_length_10610_cov_13.629436_7_plen_67_part_00
MVALAGPYVGGGPAIKPQRAPAQLPPGHSQRAGPAACAGAEGAVEQHLNAGRGACLTGSLPGHRGT